MSKRGALVAGFVLAALAAGSLAALALRDGGEEPSVGAELTPLAAR